MHDGRDANDRRLLEAREHKTLLANYVAPVQERCYLRLGTRDAGDEAAQQVFERLWRELEKGNTYRVPFRVVVWQVTDWTLKGYRANGNGRFDLPEDWDISGPDALAEWESLYDLHILFCDLPDRQREVLDLRYRLGLEHAEIARRLGIEPNAVYQALHNGHKKLREKLNETRQEEPRA